MEGEATLHLAAASPPRVEALGLREFSAAASAGPHGASAWRTFRYNGAAVALALIGGLQGGDRPPEAGVDWAGPDDLCPRRRRPGTSLCLSGVPLVAKHAAAANAGRCAGARVPGGRRLVAAPPRDRGRAGRDGDRPAGAGAGRRPGRRRAAPLRGRLHDGGRAGRAVAPRRGAGPFAARPADGLPPAVAAGAGIQPPRRRSTATAAGTGRGHALRGPTAAARGPVPGGARAALPLAVAGGLGRDAPPRGAAGRAAGPPRQGKEGKAAGRRPRRRGRRPPPQARPIPGGGRRGLARRGRRCRPVGDAASRNPRTTRRRPGTIWGWRRLPCAAAAC